MTIPCRASVDERNHDDNRGIDPVELDKRCDELADELMDNEDKLAQLIQDCDFEASTEIALAVRWFGRYIDADERLGNHATLAILNAARRMHVRLREHAMESVRDRAVRELSEDTNFNHRRA